MIFPKCHFRHFHVALSCVACPCLSVGEWKWYFFTLLDRFLVKFGWWICEGEIDGMLTFDKQVGCYWLWIWGSEFTRKILRFALYWQVMCKIDSEISNANQKEKSSRRPIELTMFSDHAFTSNFKSLRMSLMIGQPYVKTAGNRHV